MLWSVWKNTADFVEIAGRIRTGGVEKPFGRPGTYPELRLRIR